jgi:hypothetical protein
LDLVGKLKKSVYPPFGGLAKTKFFGTPLATQDKGLHTNRVSSIE